VEQKKSKVTGIIFEKSGNGKNGMWYSFNVGFENGDAGKYFASANPQTYFKLNEEAEYTKETTTNTTATGTYTNVRISPIKAQGGAGFKQWGGGSPTAANKRTALECAVSLAVVGKIEVKDIGATAVKYNTWLNDEPKAKPIELIYHRCNHYNYRKHKAHKARENKHLPPGYFMAFVKIRIYFIAHKLVF